MADSQRHLQLDALKSILETASSNTVLVCSEKLDLTRYVSADLPVIEILPGDESPQPYLTGRQALWRMRVELTCYFLGDNDWEQGEALLKEMKDAIGGNTTLNDTAATTTIKGSRPGGAFPLYSVGLSIEVVYERKISEG